MAKVGSVGTKMKVWYDEKGDFLEVTLTRQKGFFKDVGNDIWERVDKNGKILGFAILDFKKRIHAKKHEVEMPLSLSLSPISV